MKLFLAALQFLTIFPVPGRFRAGREELARSLAFFPLVGLILGLLLALLDLGLRRLFPLPLASVLLVIALLLVSGGLHCDGLADTADGFFSSRPRDRILEIMKDSRTGPMGVAAIVTVLMLKVVAFASVPAPARSWMLLLTPPAAYAAILLNIALLPYARSEGGLGGIFEGPSWGPAAAGALVILALGWLAGSLAGLAAACGALLAGYLFAAWSRRMIGGYTGDTLGAVHELSTVVPALVAAAWFRTGGGL